MTKKFISLFLSILLFSQSSLMAAPAQQKTLREYQIQIKQELKQKPWLKDYGVPLLAITGTAVGLIIFYKKRSLSYSKESIH